jgi:ketosteroid isomerase-like protein
MVTASLKGMINMASTQTGKEGAVSAAVEALRKAMVAGDKAALDKIAAAELSYGHSSGRHENKAEFIATLIGANSGFSEIKTEGETVRIVGNTALVRHIFHGTRKKDGDKVKLYTLLVWLEQQGQWKLLARHAAKL